MSIAEKRQTDTAVGPTSDAANKKAKFVGPYSTNLSFKDLIISHPVENLAYKKKGGLVFFVDRTDKVIDVFKGLVEHGFLSVPVLQKTKRKWYGFVELSDIVQFYVEQFGSQLGDEGRSAWDAIGKNPEFLEKTVDDIMQYPMTRKNVFHPITNGYSLFYAIETMAREEHLHRVPIIDEDRKLKSVLSQSQVIEFINANLDTLGTIKDKPVEQMRGVIKQVYTVKEDSLTIDAFKLMQQNSLTGVAVVNESGAVVGNLSVRDLKGLRLENQLFHRLFQTVHNFIRHLRAELSEIDSRPRTKQVVRLNDTMAHVIQILVQQNIHRVYVVDNDQKPIGVVSLKDVLLEIISS
jgi:CBS domain-containing protein